MRALSFKTERRQYLFPTKEAAQAFAAAAKRCRVEGRVTVRKALPKRVGQHWEQGRDEHWAVYVKAFAFADEAELARLARDNGGKLASN